MENDYKVLNVNTGTSSMLFKMSTFVLILAIIGIVVGIVLGFLWITDFDYDGEDYIMPFLIAISSGISLLVTWSILRALFRITEAAEYTKAKISEQYNDIREED